VTNESTRGQRKHSFQGQSRFNVQDPCFSVFVVQGCVLSKDEIQEETKNKNWADQFSF
jgi:hypothetical protein